MANSRLGSIPHLRAVGLITGCDCMGSKFLSTVILVHGASGIGWTGRWVLDLVIECSRLEAWRHAALVES